MNRWINLVCGAGVLVLALVAGRDPVALVLGMLAGANLALWSLWWVRQ